MSTDDIYPGLTKLEFIKKFVLLNRYDTPGGLSTHKKIVHIERHKRSQTNVCHLCAKSFATRTNLHEHMSTIHQPREKGQQQCGECGKW